MTKATTQDYNRDFKDQLSQKVLQRIEKRYLSSNELTDAELQAFSLAGRSKQCAFYEKVMTGSILASFGFIVSRVPLTGAQTPEQLVAMGYQKRLQLIAIGRFVKLAAYAGLAFTFYHRNQLINERQSSERFAACVTEPCKKCDAPSFYSQSQVDSMHRAYLLKANKLRKDNADLKKYKFDPQSYH